MKESFAVIAVLSVFVLVALSGLVMTGNATRTKVYWPSYDVKFSHEKVVTPQNLNMIEDELEISPKHADKMITETLTTTTCYNSDGSFEKEPYTKGFAIDRSGVMKVDKCWLHRTTNKFILQEAFCREYGDGNFLNVRTIYCRCEEGRCID